MEYLSRSHSSLVCRVRDLYSAAKVQGSEDFWHALLTSCTANSSNLCMNIIARRNHELQPTSCSTLLPSPLQFSRPSSCFIPSMCKRLSLTFCVVRQILVRVLSFLDRTNVRSTEIMNHCCWSDRLLKPHIETRYGCLPQLWLLLESLRYLRQMP